MHKIFKILLKISKKIELFFVRISNKLTYYNSVSKYIRRGDDDRDLYKTKYDDYFWLNSNKYIDKLIINHGVFEKDSTNVAKRLIKKGDIVLDVGANIGYYSVIFSKLVGDKGKVYAFEPLKEYRIVLKKNIEENKIQNCEIVNFGLSNSEKELTIYKNESSATIHTLNDNYELKEKIKLITLNKFVQEKNINRINFIKIDVDGHEPAVLNGAWDVIKKYKPIILMEISHLHYLEYGITAWDFYYLLKNKDFFIYTENDFSEIKNKTEFLYKCCNFNHSSNIIIAHDPIVL